MMRASLALAGFFSALLLGACLSNSPNDPARDSGGQDTTSFADTSGTGDTTGIGDTAGTRCRAAECGPLEFRKAFWPMAVGNSWTYVDSTFNAQGALTLVDTFTLAVTLVEFDTTKQEYWWSFSGGALIPFPATYGSLSFVMQRGDTIFGRENGLWDPIVTTQAKFGPLPTSKDTAHYPWTYGGDVAVGTLGVRNGSGYSTPAGSFTGSLSFSIWVQRKKTFEFKPGVGILGYGYHTGWIPEAEHRGRLLAYSLKP
jgi:hypothetical protein